MKSFRVLSFPPSFVLLLPFLFSNYLSTSQIKKKLFVTEYSVDDSYEKMAPILATPTKLFITLTNLKISIFSIISYLLYSVFCFECQSVLHPFSSNPREYSLVDIVQSWKSSRSDEKKYPTNTSRVVSPRVINTFRFEYLFVFLLLYVYTKGKVSERTFFQIVSLLCNNNIVSESS